MYARFFLARLLHRAARLHPGRPYRSARQWIQIGADSSFYWSGVHGSRCRSLLLSSPAGSSGVTRTTEWPGRGQGERANWSTADRRRDGPGHFRRRLTGARRYGATGESATMETTAPTCMALLKLTAGLAVRSWSGKVKALDASTVAIGCRQDPGLTFLSGHVGAEPTHTSILDSNHDIDLGRSHHVWYLVDKREAKVLEIRHGIS